jgi:hypothetical protein
MPGIIKIPEELANKIDRLAAAEHKPRAAYAVDVLWRDVRRNKQREALKLPPLHGIPPTTRSWLRAARLMSIRFGLSLMNALRTPSGANAVDGHSPPRHISLDKSVMFDHLNGRYGRTA